MKIFEKDGKINFVDDKNVFVGFDYGQCCCENFGYFFSDKTESNIIENQGDFESTLNKYNFDTDFHDTVGELAIFKLKKGKSKKAIYLHLYNSHNGYYSHGFNMGKVDSNQIYYSGSL